jgi:hypothetical protein
VLGIDFDGACVQHSVNKLVKKIKMQIYVVHKIIKKLLFFKLKKHVFVFLYKKKKKNTFFFTLSLAKEKIM